MVEIPDSLRSLFTARVEKQEDSYRVEVPASEIEQGAIDANATYRVAILPKDGTDTQTGTESEQSNETELRQADREPGPPAPPVDEGEIRDVVVESVGDQGDGIAKVERGYVVIVPGAKPGDEPTVEIEDVRENVAFATVIGA